MVISYIKNLISNQIWRTCKMKKPKNTFGVVRKVFLPMFIFFIITLMINSCQKDEYLAPVPGPKINFSVQSNQEVTAKSGKSAVNFSGLKDINSVMASNGSKSEIANGANYTIYGVGVTGFWWTDPLTAVNWNLTGPSELDTLINQRELISFTFPELGVYSLRAFSPSPYGFEWFMTITLLESLDEALIVAPDFIKSEWIATTDMFRYYWRIPRPVIFDGSETLFRTMGLSETLYDPFPAFYDQVSFFGADSIEWYFDYSPNGLTPLGVKTNVGYLNASNEEIWLTIDTASIWRCQDPVENNIIEAILYNGRVGVVGTTFEVSTDVQAGAGDHGSAVPVILIGTPVSGELPIYALADPETNLWRHRLSSETDWTELSITQEDNGRINFNLPNNPSFDQRIVQYGYFDGVTFTPDPMMMLSSMYNATVQGFEFAY